MVIDARRRLRAFLRSHAITRLEYDNGVQQTLRNLRIWKTADCDPVKEAKNSAP
jgi:D-serine dehydratase